MRPKLIVGNWKMYTLRASARDLAAAVVQRVGTPKVQVGVCPPSVWLTTVAEVVRGTPIALGAQNCHYEKEGAFTGEISPQMLLDAGCAYVILGHSERRHKLNESDAFIHRKVLAALQAGLKVILCLGETLDERKANQAKAVVDRQLSGCLAGVDANALANVVLAYEPVWAIGTGLMAEPADAQEMHAFIRGWIRGKYGEEAAVRLPIQYGGSVTPDKVAALFRQPDIDGGLIGGASLQAELFTAIVRIAEQAASPAA
jgi:triosephosphate isomerase